MPFIEALSETPLAYDNDVFTLLRNKNKSIQERVSIHFTNTKQFPALPAITVFEAFQGLEQNRKKITTEEYQFRKGRINELITTHRILDFDEKAAQIAAHVCSELGKSKCNELWYDILIVATVLASRFGLATGNKRHMELIAEHLPKENNLLQLAIWKP